MRRERDRDRVRVGAVCPQDLQSSVPSGIAKYGCFTYKMTPGGKDYGESSCKTLDVKTLDNR
ncbi:hypothetical protein [Scytonema sp. PRP1]|uniref:hypothetical protein n=1 Tax=Scytonema sp. PRP1 TaxID=3120513 RepID=UPI002FD0A2AE